jgi:hypothetical protein
MFTKLAVSRNFARRPQAAAAIALPFANDNRLERRAHGRPAGRQQLACRWHLSPATGRLECSWQVEATAAEDPDSTIIAAVVFVPQPAARPRMR